MVTDWLHIIQMENRLKKVLRVCECVCVCVCAASVVWARSVQQVCVCAANAPDFHQTKFCHHVKPLYVRGTTALVMPEELLAPEPAFNVCRPMVIMPITSFT